MPAPSPFTVVGQLTVVEASTVICLRHRGRLGLPQLIRRERLGPGRIMGDAIFAGADALDFTSGWEVLLGQAECVNWVRSTAPDRGKGLQFMRYPGEFRFAGGSVDSGETFLDAARRELEEEFLQQLPADARIRPFVVKQTMPVRSKSNIMWNFVALAEENPWLAALDVDEVNARLAQRRVAFENLVASGEFWRMSQAEKERVAPEVREMRWLPLSDALWMALSTGHTAGGGRSAAPAHYVNAFQRDEFARVGIRRRDPMFMTAVTLSEIEAYPDAASLISHCDALRRAGMQREQRRIQWLFTGMTDADVKAGGRPIQGRGEPREMIKAWGEIQRLRDGRAGPRL